MNWRRFAAYAVVAAAILIMPLLLSWIGLAAGLGLLVVGYLLWRQ